jgi:ribonuclease HI
MGMQEEKVVGVEDWPQPQTKKQLESFLGTINFYRRFIKDFSAIARPLHDLRKKDAIWKWEGKQEIAFQKLKSVMLSAPVLRNPDPTKPFVLETDASEFASGAVLLQESKEEMHPCRFYSKSHLPAERNYENHDREMLAIIKALKHWRQHLEGAAHPITIKSNNSALQYFMTNRDLSRCQAHWALYLSRFDFKIEYSAGKTIKADGLSRRINLQPEKRDNRDQTLLPAHFLALIDIQMYRTVDDYC